MITFTGVDDTPASVTHRVLGYNDDSYAKKLWNMNERSFARQLFSDSGLFARNRAVWLPGFSERESDQDWVNRHLHRLDFIPSWGRSNIVRLQKAGVDMNRLISIGKSTRYSNRVNAVNSPLITGAFAGNASFESFSRMVERTAHPAEKFSKAMENLNEKTAHLLKVHRVVHTEEEGKQVQNEVNAARAEVDAAAKDVGETLKSSAKIYNNRLRLKTKLMLKDPSLIRAAASKRNILLGDFDDVKMLSKIARHGKWAGRGCFVLSALLGADEVYQTYEDGGDAFKKAVGVGAELGAIWAVGEGLLLLFTPAGWVTLVCIAIAEGIILTLGGNVVEKFGERLGGSIEGCYDWLKNNFEYWF